MKEIMISLISGVIGSIITFLFYKPKLITQGKVKLENNIREDIFFALGEYKNLVQ